MVELNRLPISRQMELIEALANLRAEQFYGAGDDGGQFGRVQCGQSVFHRVRIGNMRFYLQFVDDGIICNHILPQHSFEDFCFRCGFSGPEDVELERNGALWHFLEESAAGKEAEIAATQQFERQTDSS
jgi:mRNA interferase RelE/StbE